MPHISYLKVLLMYPCAYTFLGVVIKAGTERNGINWGARYSSFIEQALYFYDFDDITNLFWLLYKKH